MRRPKFFLATFFAANAITIIVFTIFSSMVSAHGFMVITETTVDANNFKLSMFSQDGFSVDKAVVEYIMFNQSGQRFTGNFKQMGAGNYMAEIPTHAPAGKYTFVLRDRTYPQEVVEANASIDWPAVQGFGLILPAATGKAAGPSPFWVGLFIGLPVLLALLFTGAVVVLRKNKKQNGETSV